MSIGLCANMAFLIAGGGMTLGLFWSGFACAGVLLALSPPNPETTNWDDGGILLAMLQYGPRPRIMVGLSKVDGDWVLGLWWDCVKTQSR